MCYDLWRKWYASIYPGFLKCFVVLIFRFFTLSLDIPVTIFISIINGTVSRFSLIVHYSYVQITVIFFFFFQFILSAVLLNFLHYISLDFITFSTYMIMLSTNSLLLHPFQSAFFFFFLTYSTG